MISKKTVPLIIFTFFTSCDEKSKIEKPNERFRISSNTKGSQADQARSSHDGGRTQTEESGYTLPTGQDIIRLIEKRKEEIFSIPVDPSMQQDRDAAWNELEPDEKIRNRNMPLNPDQQEYAKNLMNRYMAGTPLEKLVIWNLVEARSTLNPNNPEGICMGSGIDGVLFERAKARLLFSALGLNYEDLFKAVDPKERELNRNNEQFRQKAIFAENEIPRLYRSYKKLGRQRLERNSN